MKESIRRAAALGRKISAMSIPVYAGQACFFIVLSLFPGLVLALGLLRYTPLGAADLMVLACGFLPDALEVYAWELIRGIYAHAPGGVVPLSALTALWSAGRGIWGLGRGLNAVGGVRETGRWLRRRLICAAYTLLFLLALVLTMAILVFGMEVGGLGREVGFLILSAGQTGLFCTMYMFLPARRSGMWESLPGAMLSSVGWMGFTALFSLYVEHFSGLANVYGSVYAVALGMLWLYGCISIFFFGAALNRFLAGKM